MKDRTWVGRALRVMLVVVMVLPFIGYFAPAASAHHPQIEGSASCDAQGLHLSVTSTSWTLDPSNYGNHDDVRVQMSTDDGATWSEIGNRWYHPDDRSFTLVFGHDDAVGSLGPLGSFAGTTVRVRAQVTPVPGHSGGWYRDDGAYNDGAGTGNDNPDATSDPIDIPRDCRANLTVEKVVEVLSGSPSTESFDFTVDQEAFHLGDRDHQDFVYVLDEQATQDVTITEGQIAEDGWTTSISCSDESIGTDTVTVTLQAGDEVRCTVTNTYRERYVPSGTIIVRKITQGGIGTFRFDLVEGDLSTPFELETVSQGAAVEKVFDGMSVDSSYSVSEDPLTDGWTLSSVACESDLNGRDISPDEFGIADGETVTCTFTNAFTPPQSPGTVTVIKNTQNPETSDEFSFLLDSYELFDDTRAVEGDGGFYTWYELPLGTYELTELVGSNPAGYSLIASSCMLEPNDQLSSAASAVQVGTPISNGVAFELGSGEHVVCTFTNRHSTPPEPEPGSITIVKQTEVSTGSFSFASSLGAFDLTTTAVGEAGRVSKVFGGLSAGTYSVSEDAVGTGWALTSATCSDGSDPSAIDLFQGEDVTCVFVNEFTQVSPTTVVNTTTTTPPETLPFTGPTSTGVGGIGAALVLLGGLVLLGFRKKGDTVVQTGVVRRLDR